MSGSLAQTIQGEAGSNPANQFAVASTIYNRMQQGTFPGGADPNAIVNAPQQFVGFNASPNSTAQTFADAIQNGTLPSMGSTGNAVNFQSGGTAARNGFTNGGTNIGGNWFSDRFGSPTSNFQPPVYGGAGSTIANGPTDTSGTGDNSGVTADSNPLGSSVTQNQPPQGAQIQTALQPEETSFITSTVSGIESAFGGGLAKAITAFETAIGNYLGGLQNWFIRAAVILLGVVLIAIALVVLMWDHGGKEVASNVARAA